MATIQTVMTVPEDVYMSLSALGLTKEKIVSEARKLLALKCFQDHLLSLGKAAALSGLSKWKFIEYLSDNGLPVIDYDDDEIVREFETADFVTERLKT